MLNFLSEPPRGVHDLLFRLMAGELGLAPVQSPATQLEQILAAHPPLKQRILAALRPGAAAPSVLVFGPLPPVEVPVSVERDASVFVSLYDTLALDRAQALGAAEERILGSYVLALAGRVLFDEPTLRAAVFSQLRAHHAAHAPEVAARNLRSLRDWFQVDSRLLQELSAG